MRELLREPWVQRGVRAALAAALAWQAAVLLPPALAQYAYYAPLGAVTIGMYRSLDTLRSADERTPAQTV